MFLVDPPQGGDVSIYLVGCFYVEVVDPSQGGEVYIYLTGCFDVEV